jgi:hypothetical protein
MNSRLEGGARSKSGITAVTRPGGSTWMLTNEFSIR